MFHILFLGGFTAVRGTGPFLRMGTRSRAIGRFFNRSRPRAFGRTLLGSRVAFSFFLFFFSFFVSRVAGSLTGTFAGTTARGCLAKARSSMAWFSTERKSLGKFTPMELPWRERALSTKNSRTVRPYDKATSAESAIEILIAIAK